MIKDYGDSSPIVKVNHPKKTDAWTIRLLISCGLACMVIFILWFIKPEHRGYSPIYWLLTFALLFKLLKMLHEWYHYWSISVPVPPAWKTKFTVDVLTTACPGEPREMIIRTLKAMVAIKYPHTNYLCDEGDDIVLKKACEELGVIHVTRIDKKDAKAGNINNALKQATGDICVVLDPDHEPIPEFLDRVLPYFENSEIGYVQCVQSYSNQSESFIARGAAEQSYHFYGPMMMCMNTYGTVQAIGANCTFRRKALDSIGGHAAGLAEDMHSAMQLQAKGWKTVYVPEILTKGLVPATLGAYYKQQLKWSRGCFELLFRTYPALFKKFTWRQKFHHFTMPLYFLFGLINFIDILVPALSLSLARVPWEVNIGRFALYFLPLCGLSMLVRLFAQRWLLEKHERGFHLAGGVLRTATWWIFLVGFIYSIFKIKVPYIPTPKEDAHQNHWKLSIPNIIISVASVLVIVYGLSIDWTPYSIAMAFYGIINVSILCFVVLISQQKTLAVIEKKIKNIPLFVYFTAPVKLAVSGVQQMIYTVLNNGPVVLILGIALLFLSYNNKEEAIGASTIREKEFGGFYPGISFFGEKKDFKSLDEIENSIQATFNVISFKNSWEQKFPQMLMKDIALRKAIPMINWQPYSEEDRICAAITHGKYDHYLHEYARHLRSYAEPVFLNFAPCFDDAEISWSLSGNNSPEEFKEAWQYVYTFFNDLGISNVTWVWNPKYPSAINYYPGSQFVDWIGISCLNYGEDMKDNDWYSFSDLYLPCRNKLGALQKPVLITEFGTPAGADQALWMDKAFKDIKENFREIRSLVIYNGQKKIVFPNKASRDTFIYKADFSIQDKRTIASLKNNFQQQPFVNKPFLENSFKFLASEHQFYQSKFIKGPPGKFELLIDGKPFYIRGVAYNTAHDWRDGNMPLTRRQLESDLEKIKSMGANTIRRYSYNIYDKNVLNIAEEYELKVLFGFWFDPKIDYYKDTLKVKEYIENVERKILEYKDHQAVLAWSLGNETWGLLKHGYSKPYLTKVRQHYVKLIELLAERIHELDPSRPVFSSVEHEIYQLPGELAAFHDGAPSIDAIGINSYYKEQISQVNRVGYQFDSLRPYFISEFGPRGYWDKHFNRTSNGLLIEDSETEKSEWYKDQWENYVLAYKGYNIGGIAYCWHDRMEGSYTWFGLTDYKGRLKPGYHALRELWTDQKPELLPEFAIKGPESIVAGRKHTFTAVPSVKTKNLHYEWQLYKDDYLEQINTIEYTEGRNYVSFEIPKDAFSYRLYLYVSDGNGNVTTASIPIQGLN